MDQAYWKNLFNYLSLSAEKSTYSYCFAEFIKRYRLLQEALGKYFEILFSFKSNPNSQLISYLHDYTQCGADVSSGKELELACDIGFSHDKIFFVGPGKSVNELKQAIHHQKCYLIVESLSEISKINAISQYYNIVTPILLRVNPDYQVYGARMNMGGRSTQFGIDQNVVEELIVQGKDKYAFVKILGIQCYVGTRIMDAKHAATNIINVLEFFKNLTEKNCDLKIVDVGGGLGIPYYFEENEMDLNKFSEELKTYMDNYPPSLLKQTRFLLEAGRFLSGPMGQFLTRIEYCDYDGEFQNINVACTPAQHGLSNGGALTGNHSFLCGVLNESGLQQGNIKTKIWYFVNGEKLPWPTTTLLPRIDNRMNYLVFMNSGAYGPTTSRVWAHLEGFPFELADVEGDIKVLTCPQDWHYLADRQTIISFS